MAEEARKPSEEVVSFDATVFDIESVKRAAYRFIDRFSVDIRLDTTSILCVVRVENGSPAAVQRLISDFRSEVLDQDLRMRIAAETSSMRNAILSIAFSASSLKDGR